MRSTPEYLAILAQLDDLDDAAERATAWRQGLAALAAIAAEREPAPLEGLPPERLLAGVRRATAEGLIDDLGFLSPAAAGLALFELASALPAGAEKRDLGRRVLTRLHEGDGATFVALATALAQASRRGLGGPIRSRVALALAAPVDLGAGASVDGLALALVARRDLEREWLIVPSVGALPARRLAARLVERAAREAVRRQREGDDNGLMIFQRATLRDTMRRLLADRESLVWRHAAAARGVLSTAMAELGADLQRDLGPGLGPTEWRRAAASLAATLGTSRTLAPEQLRELLHGPQVEADPGVAAALLGGLLNGFVMEPEAADLIAAEAIERVGLPAIAALADLLGDLGATGRTVAEWSVKAARAWIETEVGKPSTDDGVAAQLLALRAELSGGETSGLWPIATAIDQGQRCAVQGDFAGARDAARTALAAAHEVCEWLEQSSDELATDRRHGFRVLRELDQALLQKDVVHHLLTLGLGEDARAPELGALQARFERWLVSREGAAAPNPPPHPAMRLQRLRALVHVVDCEIEAGDDGFRERRLAVVRTLLRRARTEHSELRRAVLAALARACDALVRDELVELSDVVCALTSELGDGDAVPTVCEATMLPDLARVLVAYGAALAAAERARAAGPGQAAARRDAVTALTGFARALPPATAPRVEALRVAVLRIASGLGRLESARSLAAIPDDALDRLEQGAQALAEQVAGARRRLTLGVASEPGAVGVALRDFTRALARARAGHDGQLADEASRVGGALDGDLPAPMALIIEATLAGLGDRPIEGGEADDDEPEIEVLPAWLPPSRTIGGFYVLRSLAAGAVGSVLVACRAEERHAAEPELFALKVPEYGGSAARSLSEDEFLRLFREEARALLALPTHPNLSGFVTFDAGARPKPILVMELVRGLSLDAALERDDLDTGAALALLDGIAAGLEVMHASRIAHLDLKPANIILRGEGRAATPVLIDFGLAGRRLRPGCGSPHYGAPEVWSEAEAGRAPAPPADVYAFACLAHEVLTRRVLVTGDGVMAVIARHLAGQLPLDALTGQHGLVGLARLLGAALARDHADRPTITELRAGLRQLGPELAARPWPLAAT